MLIKLIRNQSEGASITGRLVINGRWFCNTLERVGYEIPALCYHLSVTQSPKFKRLLPLVTNVPRTPQRGYGTATPIGRAESAMGYRQGIRFHRGTKPQHSTGCILVVADNWRGVEWCRMVQNGVESSSVENTTLHNTTQPLPNSTPPKGRTAADIENQLTQLLLQTQESHEEIILEVTDYRPGTEYGYNTPCPPELQKR